MPRSCSACIFDLDGTLLDTLPDLVVLTNIALEQCGFPPRTSEEILSYVGNGHRSLMQQAVPDGADQSSLDHAISLWENLTPEYGSRMTKPYPGIEELLSELRSHNIKLAVLSNKFHEGTTHLIEHFFPDLFEVVYGVCDEIPRKPEPKGLLKVVAELGVLPHESWYIGDSLSDNVTAEAAGSHGVCVTWGYHSRAVLETAPGALVIDEPRELLKYVL